MKLSRSTKMAHRPFRRLCNEILEQRQMLTVITVSSLADDGVGSLRQAIQLANLNPGLDQIVFNENLAGQINLTSGELTITEDVVIEGGDVITVSGNNQSRVFNVDDGDDSTDSQVEIRNIDITDGNADNGGGIQNSERLTLTNASLTGNNATENGGGISNNGFLTLNNSNVDNNSAGRDGGGVASEQSAVQLNNSSVSNNTAEENGGGLSIQGGELTSNGSTISGNSAEIDGGGVSAFTASVKLENGTNVDNNSAPTGGGASLSQSTIQVRDSSLNGNTSQGTGGSSQGIGGGIVGFNSLIELINAALSNNESSRTGGGVECSFGCSLNSQGSTFTNNLAPKGAAIGIGESASADIDTTSFSGNAGTSNGGAMYLAPRAANQGGTRFNDPDVIITNSLFTNNEATFDGGALNIERDNHVRIENTTFDANSASFGGGIFVDRAILECDDCTLTGNSAETRGGGIASDDDATLVINNSLFDGNSSGSFGGALTLDNGASLNIDTSTFVNNTASVTGAIGTTTNNNVTIQNSTVSGNTATGRNGGVRFGGGSTVKMINTTVANNTGDDGGGVYINAFSGTFEFESVTIASNTAIDDGGGVFVTTSGSPTISFKNSVIADNTAGDLGNDSFGPMQIDFSLLEDITDATFTGGNNLTGVDPQLGPLANNGGPTQTMSLGGGSPAIDAGDPSAVAGQSGVPDFDQRAVGFNRVVDGRIDMGAFETGNVVSLACDFDSNGSCDINDLILFYPELGGSNATFDLDGSGLIDNDDLTEWLNQATAADPQGRTFVRGDANLDGAVGGGDFTLLAANFGQAGGWAQGNFVVDAVAGGGTIGGADFTALAANFGFASALTAAGDRSEASSSEDRADDDEFKRNWIVEAVFAV